MFKGASRKCSPEQKFFIQVKKTKTCWLWQGMLCGKGYGKFIFERRLQYAHRVSYQLFVGSIPEGLCVLHKCDVPACVNPKHLFLGTNLDNVQDMMQKGRLNPPRGVRNALHKLTDNKVRRIRHLYSRGVLQNRLAKDFGVSKTCIWCIVVKRTWKHI